MSTEAVPTVIQEPIITLREAANVRVLPGAEMRLHMEGTYFRVMESTGPFKVRFNGGGAAATFDKSLGFEVGRDQFKYFDIINTDLFNTLIVTVIATDGRVEDNRVSISSANAIPVINQTPAPPIAVSGIIALPAAGSIQIAPADPTRTEIKIQNMSAVPVLLNGGIWVLLPGDTLKLPFGNAFFAETVGNFVGRIQVIGG
ncbi:MAG: hypothetical protein COA52_09660 [Hyphomicrobiales bacterium]|nr:MAG: hypothetical protein COA52_09660 [Hyphomicrobiales bacterium]